MDGIEKIASDLEIFSVRLFGKHQKQTGTTLISYYFC
jgi:hypothetical protein